jgi:purine-cytosine permease-like protein
MSARRHIEKVKANFWISISIGSATTLFYGLNLRDAALMIIFFDIIFCLPAAYIVTIAPRTGMRQMIQSRYTFG